MGYYSGGILGGFAAVVRKKILIVDQNENIRFAFRRFLETEGYHIYETQTLDEALSLLHSSEYVAAFVDLSEQVSGSPETIDQMQKMARNLSLYIISSQATPNHFNLLNRVGAAGLLEKPLSIIQLRKLLKKIGN